MGKNSMSVLSPAFTLEVNKLPLLQGIPTNIDEAGAEIS